MFSGEVGMWGVLWGDTSVEFGSHLGGIFRWAIGTVWRGRGPQGRGKGGGGVVVHNSERAQVSATASLKSSGRCRNAAPK